MKRIDLPHLAIFDRPPAFDETLHVGRPNVGNPDRALELMRGALERKWLTNRGPLVRELEEKLAEQLGVRHCIVMSNGTVALEIAIRALGLSGEVIVPSWTFIATAHALQWQQITPVFCDIDPKTQCIDPNQVETLITPRTTGILGVHLWGRACPIEPLAEMAERRGLKLLFDAAHAFGCTYRGRRIGSFGTAEVFSFHATKFFHTCEGGAIATNDDALAEKMRLMKNFGFAGVDNVNYIGTNGKMSEISAAMGLANLECLDMYRETNRRNYHEYRRRIDTIPGLSLLEYDEAESNNYQYIVIEVDSERAGLTRDHLIQVLEAENVLARRYFHPGCHRMEPYRSTYPDTGKRLPQTERMSERVMILPTGTSLDQTDVAVLSKILADALSHASDVLDRVSIPVHDTIAP